MREFHISSFNEKLVLGAKKFAEKRNFAATDISVSRSTENRYKTRFAIGVRDCQLKTDARVQTEKFSRNMLSFACMNEAFCSILLAYMIFNWDATQFVINPDGSCKIVFVKHDPNCNEPYITASSGRTGFASGIVDPAVFNIADSDMDDDDVEWVTIVGLQNAMGVGQYGYLCFCKTRNCNAS